MLSDESPRHCILFLMLGGAPLGLDRCTHVQIQSATVQNTFSESLEDARLTSCPGMTTPHFSGLLRTGNPKKAGPADVGFKQKWNTYCHGQVLLMCIPIFGSMHSPESQGEDWGKTLAIGWASQVVNQHTADSYPMEWWSTRFAQAVGDHGSSWLSQG